MRYSVITPMFNSFEYMERFLISLENQKRDDAEIIIVDDFSTDNSFENMNKYAVNSELHIKCYRLEKNMGPGEARNYALGIAEGEWVTFIDSDDWIPNNYFAKMDTYIEETNADCIVYDYCASDGTNDIRVVRGIPGYDCGFINPHDMVSYGIAGHVKCLKLSLINNQAIRYPHMKRAEDMVFWALVFAKNLEMSIYYTKEVMYFALQRKFSLSRSVYKDSVMKPAYEILSSQIDHECKDDLRVLSIRMVLYGEVLMMCQAHKSKKEIQKLISWYEESYTDWYSNPCINKFSKTKRLFLKWIYERKFFLMRLFGFAHKFAGFKK